MTTAQPTFYKVPHEHLDAARPGLAQAEVHGVDQGEGLELLGHVLLEDIGALLPIRLGLGIAGRAATTGRVGSAWGVVLLLEVSQLLLVEALLAHISQCRRKGRQVPAGLACGMAPEQLAEQLRDDGRVHSPEWELGGRGRGGGSGSSMTVDKYGKLSSAAFRAPLISRSIIRSTFPPGPSSSSWGRGSWRRGVQTHRDFTDSYYVICTGGFRS